LIQYNLKTDTYFLINLDQSQELNLEPIMTGNATLLACTLSEFHLKYVIKQKEKDPQGDPSSGGMRP
jgi:hypothetical protein